MSNPAQARAVAEAMLALWQREFPATVRVLSSVSEEGRNHCPDGKSRSAWQLVTHLATADLWFMGCIERGVFQFDAEAAKRQEDEFQRVSDVVAWYQQAFPAGIERLRGLSDEQLAEPLNFFGMMNMSRAEWIGFSNNHCIHHRGQLSSYLRGMGSKVPDIYGPSGDAEPAAAAG